MRRVWLAASLLSLPCVAAPAALAGIAQPAGNVSVSYGCENVGDGDFAAGQASAGTGISYEFADGIGGNLADTSLAYTSFISATATLDSRALILLPGAATTAQCQVGGSVNLTQPISFTSTAGSVLTDTVTISIEAIVDGWQAQVPPTALTGTQASLDFQAGVGASSLFESFVLEPTGLTIGSQPNAWTVDPLLGGGVSVSGNVVISATVPTSAPAILEMNADQFSFVPAGTAGFSVTNTLPPDAVRFQVVSLTPGVRAFTLGVEPPPVVEPQTKPQQKCLTGLNKAAAKVVRAQLKVNEKCLKDAIKGKIPSVQMCAESDPQGGVGKAAQKAMGVDAKKCQDKPEQLPSFSYVPASTTSFVAMDEAILSMADLLGPDADLALPTLKEQIGCQKAVTKASDKYLVGILKEAIKAKKKALKDGAASPSDLEAAMEDAILTSGKLTKLVGKLEKSADRKCGDVPDLGQIFPGTVAIGVTPQSLSAEAARAALCRACLLLDNFDALSLPCDTLDDGASNTSCLPPKST